jgi:predicted dehydrogenase
MTSVRFGIIGLGLMGREFASAAARWHHLSDMKVEPVITAICAKSLGADREAWYRSMSPHITLVTKDYRDVLASADVDAVYIAVPHNLHHEMYTAAIEAGKHLMGEKPFGIDRPANRAIMQAIAKHPDVFVRCSSEFPFTPAVQALCRMIEENELGRIIEVEAGFLHSSDMDPDKPINWKRIPEYNGEYGCMGDLGLHVCHVPFRAGWIPTDVRAVLSNIMPERPDKSGKRVPCETWDNATLLCSARSESGGETFPMTLKTQRIAPGETNTWYLKVLGTRASARFTTKHINTLEVLRYENGNQNWCTIDIGHRPAFASITGGIFEFGFSDALLQMWAAFLHELETGSPKSTFAGCATPDEAALSHDLFTASLRSQERTSVEPVLPACSPS